jgi:hypothetical protein
VQDFLYYLFIINILHIHIIYAYLEAFLLNIAYIYPLLFFSGHLVPDEIVCRFAVDRLSNRLQEKDYKGFILDGFPRTVNQAKELTKQETERLKIKRVIDIYIDTDVAVEKLLARRQCKTCGKDGFNVADIQHSGYMMPPLLPSPSTCPLGN